nr:hypothetical protein CFP56_03018 [Quercus suber]
MFYYGPRNTTAMLSPSPSCCTCDKLTQMNRHLHIFQKLSRLLIFGILSSVTLCQNTASSPSWTYPPSSSDSAASLGTVQMSDTIVLEWTPESDMPSMELSCLSVQGRTYDPAASVQRALGQGPQARRDHSIPIRQQRQSRRTVHMAEE